MITVRFGMSRLLSRTIARSEPIFASLKIELGIETVMEPQQMEPQRMPKKTTSLSMDSRRPWSAPARVFVCFLVSLAAICSTGILWAETASAQEIPTPESVLGHKVGDDFFLASYDESMAYFEKLAAASDRVRLVNIGKTSFGLDWKIALVSSAENLRNAEQIREISQRLAHPEGLSDEDAKALARQGKAVVHIDAGLHATEVAHAQHTLELAYMLAVENEDPEILAILDRVLLVLWPSMNPDGQNMVVDWYRSNLGTPFEVAPMVRLYQKYVGHDNNRDGYMLNTLESRVTTATIRHWEPQILYNHHQTAPFPARIWIPPFAEPISPHVHPLMWRTVNLVGMAMAQALEERGQEGAVHMGSGFDNWYPGFMDHANNFHNVASFLTETGLYLYATPHFYRIDDFPKSKKDLRPGSLYPSPWKGGWWRLRDAVEYMVTASISVLDVAAKYKEDVLYNRYQAGRDVIRQYREDPPYAYFIPKEQKDPVAAVEMLRRLAFNGIEVKELADDLEFEGRLYRAGDWVIPMDQPFAHFARQLFDIQSYPDLRVYPEGPPDQPYDVSGWTLNLQMGVDVVAAMSPLTAEQRGLLADLPVMEEGSGAEMDSALGLGFDSHPTARAILPRAGEIKGAGPRLRLDPSQNNSYRFVNRAWDAGAQVAFVQGGEGADGEGGESGFFVVEGLAPDQASRWTRDLALQVVRTKEQGRRISRPKVGLFRPFRPSMDEGWTRWILERWEIPFENLNDAQVRAGDLRSRFDVLVIPSIGTRALERGFTKGQVPDRYSGGLGDEGARALAEFVRLGGTLVTLNDSSRYAIEKLFLPVEDVTAGAPRDRLFIGGSIVEMEVDASHPAMSGMDDRSAVFVAGSPVFRPLDDFEGRVFAKYPSTGSPLLSGYLLGEEKIQGYASALEVRQGEGRVILLGMRPQWRAQPFGTFKILFNSLMLNDIDIEDPDSAFWYPPASQEQEDAD